MSTAVDLRTARCRLIEGDPTVGAAVDATCEPLSPESLFAEVPMESLLALQRDPKLSAELMRRLRTLQLPGPNRVWAAVNDEGRRIGYVQLAHTDSAAPDLRVALMPEFRGRGYGREIAAGVLRSWFRENPEGSVMYCVSGANEKSVSLALRLGGVYLASESREWLMLFRVYRITAASFRG